MRTEARTWDDRCDAARSVPIAELVSRLGLSEPKKCGKQLLMRCPFHDDRRPSLYLEPVKGWWKCFGCGEGGDSISLWMRERGVGFADAVREIIP